MIWFLALLLNTVLIAAAQRAPLLTPVGWVHAGALGTILWGCLGWRGWVAVVAYLVLGSLGELETVVRQKLDRSPGGSGQSPN